MKGESGLKIQFTQEPGYVHDLFYIFMTAYGTAETAGEEDMRRIGETFGTCPPELSAFFYPREDGETFVASLYEEVQEAGGPRGGRFAAGVFTGRRKGSEPFSAVLFPLY